MMLMKVMRTRMSNQLSESDLKSCGPYDLYVVEVAFS
jgi:hypothetical protein